MNNELLAIILGLIFFILILILVFVVIGPKWGLNIWIFARNNVP